MPDIHSRIKCIFFLATPHRGSDYAATLNNILALSTLGSARQYISELKTGSASMVQLNEKFGRHAHDLHIFSFYETMHTSLGVSSALIVDRGSAVLGMNVIYFRAALTGQQLTPSRSRICQRARAVFECQPPRHLQVWIPR